MPQLLTHCPLENSSIISKQPVSNSYQDILSTPERFLPVLAIRLYRWLVNIVPGNGLVPLGSKLLPWGNDDPRLCCHRALPSHNELTTVIRYMTGNDKLVSKVSKKKKFTRGTSWYTVLGFLKKQLQKLRDWLMPFEFDSKFLDLCR